ncbi:trafficking protein particle complex II-specific subunit 130 homolog [Zingiber officinale]|uniref:trafficking protein particle complex II-specific subunit 130 homolog n=1 Tax=Zingiber officinale TaxID=94328 RepID=UPI001C4D8297|nr:trafficking protein particle complex II-specific subunit 130 homolog [Zingiber officinale]
MVEGMRTIALKLEFGAFRNQIFERTIAVHFTNPFYVTSRVANKCNDGTLLLQATIHSQVKATLCLYDAWLDLQAGFVHVRKENGRVVSSFFPLIISPSSTVGILFSICIDKMAIGGTFVFTDLECLSLLHRSSFFLPFLPCIMQLAIFIF